MIRQTTYLTFLLVLCSALFLSCDEDEEQESQDHSKEQMDFCSCMELSNEFTHKQREASAEELEAIKEEYKSAMEYCQDEYFSLPEEKIEALLKECGLK